MNEFWVTDKEIPRYGYAADLNKLPIGTTFHVNNGAWSGRIVEHNGQKAVQFIDNFHSNVWDATDKEPIVIRDDADLVIDVDYDSLECAIALEAFNLYEQMEMLDGGGITPVINNINVRLDQKEHLVNIDYTFKEECGLSDCHYHTDTTLHTAKYDFTDGMIKRNGQAIFNEAFSEESKKLQEEFFTQYKDFFPKTYEEYQKQKELDMENQEYEGDAR